MSDLLSTHRTLLNQYRNSMNLIGPGPVQTHYDDAERSLSWLTPAGHWADLGTGAGLPGIPFAARFPHVALDLVDSRMKRCIFLEKVIAQADLGDRAPIKVLCTRVETLPDATYDGLIARAFAKPPALLDHARRLLKPGGTLVMFLLTVDALPEDEEFETTHVERYHVGGKPRVAIGLRRR